MKKVLFVLLFSLLFLSCFADWDVGDPYKMHFPQLPDPNGWDVAFSLIDGLNWLGDDFLCTETGQITDIHFWISWMGDNEYIINHINVGIWSNLPPIPPNYSQPLEELWYHEFYQGEFTIAGPWTGNQGWFDPNEGWIPNDHQMYWQINIENIPDPFWQTADTTYWLLIQVFEEQNLVDHPVGWKTSLDPWEDNAVWGWPGEWYELIDPVTGASLNFAFVITNDTQVPVQLSSYTAAFSNGTPTLFWTTQSESNNIGWNVYRSDNVELEQSIQINSELVPGAGTTSEPTDYIFEDDYEVIVDHEYWYWIESVENSGETETYGPISLTIPEDGEEPNIPEIPDIYGLHQNYPNPFNPNTRISYRMDVDCIGTLSIYNLKGEKIVTLFENREMTADEKAFVEWDSKDDNGNRVSSGVYIYELNTDARDYSRKMVLTK